MRRGAAMAHVFLSYARADKQWVDYLFNWLVAEKGFPVWMDQELLGSMPWSNVLGTAIRDSAAVVVVLSPRVTPASYVINEVGEALKLNKPIIPVLIEGCTLPSALLHLNSLHQIDFTRNSFPQAADSLARTLAWLGIQCTPPPAPIPKLSPLREIVIGSWNVQMRWQNLNLQLTIFIAPPPANQFGGNITIPSPGLPEIKPYSGIWSLNGNELTLDGYWQSLYESKQWRQPFYIDKVAQDSLHGFTPPENQPCVWTRVRL
jgi:hypothetical protein